jgi:hypothetical protein
LWIRATVLVVTLYRMTRRVWGGKSGHKTITCHPKHCRLGQGHGTPGPCRTLPEEFRALTTPPQKNPCATRPPCLTCRPAAPPLLLTLPLPLPLLLLVKLMKTRRRLVKTHGRAWGWWAAF